jgi:hypothetical protein
MRLLTLTLAVPLTCTGLHARADCDAALVEALRTRYNQESNLKLEEAVARLVCSRSSSSRSSSLDGSYEGFGLSYGQSKRSAAEACMRNDSSFFLQHRQQLGLSFVPETAIANCFGGLSFTARQTSNGGTIAVAAAYAPREDGSLAVVDKIDWEPKSALTCSADWVGQTIIPGGKRFLCTRQQNVDVTFVLNTNKGGRDLTVLRAPVVGRAPLVWTYSVNMQNQRLTRCKNQFGEFVGDWRNCSTDGTCHNKQAIEAMCQTVHGSEYVTIDGAKLPEGK